jgi:hypothetical protein
VGTMTVSTAPLTVSMSGSHSLWAPWQSLKILAVSMAPLTVAVSGLLTVGLSGLLTVALGGPLTIALGGLLILCHLVVLALDVALKVGYLRLHILQILQQTLRC